MTILPRFLLLLTLLLSFSPASPQTSDFYLGGSGGLVRNGQGHGGQGGGGNGGGVQGRGGGGTGRNQNACPANWRDTRKQYNQNLHKWERKAPSTRCYNMTIQPTCFCAPPLASPHQVVVKNGKAQNSTTDEFSGTMPTINDLFRLVDRECIKNCPKQGAGVCNITYNQDYGYITTLFINPTKVITDRELNYTVSNVTFCAKK
jgi:hypothetical protein